MGKLLLLLCFVFGACCASAYMTITTLRERDALMWTAERSRESAVFCRVKYKVMVQKYEEQEKLLNLCEGRER